MPTFEEFVQNELPRRPFVTEDGAPGQYPVRSSNADHPLEMVWVAGPTPQNELRLEAGENLAHGTPVKVIANKLYAASHATDPLVIGLLDGDVDIGFVGVVKTSGPISITGLTPGTPYFLGVGAIASAAPGSGYVTRIGSAITTGTLIINIEEPILLA